MVQHGANLAELPATEAIEKIVFVQVVSDIAVGQVAKLVAVSQIVDGDDIGFITLVEGLNQVATDKTGGAGHNDSHAMFPL